MAWRQWLNYNWLLWLLLTACVVRMWLMVLPSSFWTDETATAFVVRLAGDASLDAVPQVPASIYYSLPRAAERLLGFSEISYRIPSLLLMGIAFFLIARLAERLIGRGAGWFAVFVCFALTDLNYYAVDARPYALGICVAAAALLFLVKWHDTAGWTQGLLFLLFAALLWRVQLVFWAFYPVFGVYTLLRVLSGSGKVGWVRAAAMYVLLGAALLPTAFQALGLLKSAEAHVIFLVPGVRTFIYNVNVYLVACSLVFILVAAFLLKWPRNRPMPIESWTLVVGWWLGMPVCLWLYSVLSGTSLFVPRYFSPALPGAAMASTAVAALYLPRHLWKQAAVFAGVVALAVSGHWSVLWPNHTRDIWREGARTERLVAEADTPVIAVSPFVEAQAPVWRPDYYLPGFLYAPLFTYPLRGVVYPFPILVSDDGEQYAAKLVRQTLVQRPRFVVFGSGRLPMHWVVWFAGRPDLAGWSYQVHRDDAIETVVFEKPR
jgi:hypothetical protein